MGHTWDSAMVRSVIVFVAIATMLGQATALKTNKDDLIQKMSGTYVPDVCKKHNYMKKNCITKTSGNCFYDERTRKCVMENSYVKAKEAEFTRKRREEDDLRKERE